MKTTGWKNNIRCEGCLALTGNYLCDLGRKTQKDILKLKGIRKDLKQLDLCHIDDYEEYFIEHMYNM
jgi:hypothetical protein